MVGRQRAKFEPLDTASSKIVESLEEFDRRINSDRRTHRTDRQPLRNSRARNSAAIHNSRPPCFGCSHRRGDANTTKRFAHLCRDHVMGANRPRTVASHARRIKWNFRPSSRSSRSLRRSFDPSTPTFRSSKEPSGSASGAASPASCGSRSPRASTPWRNSRERIRPSGSKWTATKRPLRIHRPGVGEFGAPPSSSSYRRTEPGSERQASTFTTARPPCSHGENTENGAIPPPGSSRRSSSGPQPPRTESPACEHEGDRAALHRALAFATPTLYPDAEQPEAVPAYTTQIAQPNPRRRRWRRPRRSRRSRTT